MHCRKDSPAFLLTVILIMAAVEGLSGQPAPVINFNMPACYNTELTLSCKPAGYASIDRIWEYAVFGKQWQKVPGFDLVLSYVAVVLREQYPGYNHCESCNMDAISNAITKTDYSFMKDHYQLYLNPELNKYEIANLLRIGIQDQNPGLSLDEQSYLSSYFIIAFVTVDQWTPPVMPSVSSWSHLGTVKGDEIRFIPSSLGLPAEPGMITLAFRVKIGATGQYSKTQLTDIKPRPPTFTPPVNVTPSCSNKPTGEVTVKGIQGLLPDNKYTAILVIGESGLKTSFTGTQVKFDDVGAGICKLKLAYNNDVLGGCYSESDLTVSKRPELKYRITEVKDESCPEKNDGVIKVAYEQGHGEYSFTLNNKTYTTPTATFESLSSGTYKLQVKDQCMDAEDFITINEPAPVTIKSIVSSSPSCKSEPDGSLTVTTTGPPGSLQYILYKNGVVYESVSTGTSKSFAGLEGGNYNVRVSHAGCAPDISETVSLASVQAVSFTASVTAVDCFGKNTGKIAVVASGGNHSYQYSIDNGAFTGSPSFTSLYQGNHIVKVKSTAANCNDQAEGNYFVGTAPKIEIGFSQVANPSCSEKDDGKITVSVTGGTGAYTYSWDESGFPLPGNSNTIDKLIAGNYRVNIRDAKNCTASKQVALTDPPELVVLSATITDAVCFGQNGSINVQATGGTGAYLYSSNASSGFTGSPKLTLPPGEYGVYVKDANGCLASYGESVGITGPAAPLDFTYTSSQFNSFNIDCAGNSNGSITVLATGGNGLKNDGSSYSGYLYSLAGSPNQSSPSFSLLRAGSYNMKVTDARGCMVQKQVILTEPDPLTLNLVSTTTVKCSGDATGELIVAASGGIENTWKYSIDGTEMLTTGIFKNLQARTYEIAVTDLNGCSKSILAAVESPYPPISITSVGKDVSCFGGNNGEITTTVTGGAGGFSFAWEKLSGESWVPIGGTTAGRINMQAGDYRVKATDSENCYEYGFAAINEPPLLQITGVSSEDAVCYGETGSIHIEGSGGTGELIYLYSKEGSTLQSSLPDVTVPSGVYTISLKDGNECIAVYPEAIRVTSPPEPLSLNFVLSDYEGYNVSCHGREDGSITALASGGNGTGFSGYSYNITGSMPGSENIFTGMKAGTYDITVADGRGCSITKPVTLTEPESLITLRASSVKNPVCTNDQNGAVTLEATGGALPYFYSVNDGLFTDSPAFTDLKPDSYTFRVRDRNGCSEVFTTTLTNTVSEMSITGYVTDVGCFGEKSGAIDVSVTGGSKPYSYYWIDTDSKTALASGLKSGSYSLVVTDSAGCTTEQRFFVKQPEVPLSLAAFSSPACVDLENGLIEVSGWGGTPPYRYGIGDRPEMGTSASINAYSGDYKVYISDYNNCLAETRVSVGKRNIMPDINFMLASSRYELDTLVVVDVSVPPPDRLTWEFSPEAYVIETGNDKALVKYNSAGLYPVKMTGLFGSCEYTMEKILNIAPFDPSVLPDSREKDGIKSIKISPNPNDGRFELKVELYTRQKITVRIFDMKSGILFTGNYPPDISFLKEITLPPTVMPGTYVLHVTSENDTRTIVFIISE